MMDRVKRKRAVTSETTRPIEEVISKEPRMSTRVTRDSLFTRGERVISRAAFIKGDNCQSSQKLVVKQLELRSIRSILSQQKNFVCHFLQSKYCQKSKNDL